MTTLRTVETCCIEYLLDGFVLLRRFPLLYYACDAESSAMVGLCFSLVLSRSLSFSLVLSLCLKALSSPLLATRSSSACEVYITSHCDRCLYVLDMGGHDKELNFCEMGVTLL
jgi:hypothetical protein